MNTNISQSERVTSAAYAFDGALRGSAAGMGVRVVAPATVPSTGEVRPQLVVPSQPTHIVAGTDVVDGKDGILVRSWSPPV